MRNSETCITDLDARRLRSHVRRIRARTPAAREAIAPLTRRITSARIVAAADVPRNVVTLNSRVALRDLDSMARVSCTLSEPSDVKLFGDRLSVAGPAGAALLGARVGQVVRWSLGPRTRRYRVEQIHYQPEAAGDYHL